MLVQLAHHFVGVPVTVVCDSWFGNDGLFKPVRKHLGASFHLLSRLRSNTVLYSMAPTKRTKGNRGRPCKYGSRLGACTKMAARIKSEALCHSVYFYGHYRTVLASTKVVMLKTLKCHVRVVWIFRKTQLRDSIGHNFGETLIKTCSSENANPLPIQEGAYISIKDLFVQSLDESTGLYFLKN
ncbi:transposase [Thermodesulfobacteriota bacterium]